MGTSRLPFTPSVSLAPWKAFGLRTDIVGNIHYSHYDEIIYPVAGVLAIHNQIKQKQRFKHFDKDCSLHIIALSPNRKQMAIVEKNPEPTICIYDVGTMKRRRVLTMPEEDANNEPSAIAFTSDSKGIAVLTKEPDPYLVLYFFDKAETIVVGEASSASQQTITTTCIACSLSDTGLVAIGGQNTLKLMASQDKKFEIVGGLCGDGLVVTSMAFITEDVLIVGTAQTQIVLVQRFDMKFIFHAGHLALIDLSNAKNSNMKDEKDVDFSSLDEPVTCVTKFAKGFAYAVHNVLMVFLRESDQRFSKRTVITIPMTRFEKNLYEIRNVAINAAMDRCLVTTKHAQIYQADLFVKETYGLQNIEFDFFGEPLHNNKIVGMATCTWRPIIMTTGRDNYVQIWNFETGTVELSRKLSTSYSAVSLHPSGFFAALSSISEVQLVEILLDNLKPIKIFNYAGCHQVLFSHQGHNLAIVCRCFVTIISTFSFKVVHTLREQTARINSVIWSSDDKFLMTASADGVISTCCTRTWERLNECVHSDISYQFMQMTTDKKTIYITTSKGKLRQLESNEVVHELNPPDTPNLTNIALSRLGTMMFLSSESGHILNVQLPLFGELGAGTFTNYPFFHNKVTRILISFDDKILGTSSADGTMVLWNIKASSKHFAPFDNSLMKNVDVVIPRRELMLKNQEIVMLVQKCIQQEINFKNQQSEGAAMHVQQMKTIHEDYAGEILKLSDTNTSITNSNLAHIQEMADEMANVIEQHQVEQNQMQAELEHKIVVEHEKSRAVELKVEQMIESYNSKIIQLTQSYDDKLDDQEEQYCSMKNELSARIARLEEFIRTSREDLELHNKMVQIANEKANVEARIRCEEYLDDERKRLQQKREEGCFLEKKLTNANNRIEGYCNERNKLKADYYETQDIIRQLNNTIEGLRKSLDEHSAQIQEKEKKIDEMQRHNSELVLFRNVLNVRLDEVRGQVEPRELIIKQKRDIITDMEVELFDMKEANNRIALALSDTKDKEVGANIDLKYQRKKRIFFEALTDKMKSDICNVSKNLNHPHKLKEGVISLHFNYAGETDFEKSAAYDDEAKNEYTRQRDHLTLQLENCSGGVSAKRRVEGKSSKSVKLVDDNIFLLNEMTMLQKELNDQNEKIKELERKMGGSG